MSKKRSQRAIDSRYWLIPLTLAAVVIWGPQITQGGFGWSDAPLHVMDGVFLRDMLVHWRGGESLHDWACQYYARYPTLGLIVYYPPFFAVVEAIMFLIFGISAVVARATVILFALVALFACYWVARQLLDQDSAIFAAAIWAALPSTVLWSRQVMLEAPTVAMILLSCGLYLKFRANRQNVRWLAAAAALWVLAVLTKQWAVFIAPVFVIDLIRTVGWRKTITFPNALTAAVAGGIVFGYLLFSASYAHLSRLLLRGPENWAHLLALESWTFYLKALPDVFGWPVLVFAVAGLLLLAASGKAQTAGILTLWAIGFYLFASVIWYKEPRYAYLVAPVAAILAAGGFRFAVKTTKLKRACTWLLIILICWQFLDAWRRYPGRWPDYRPAADLVSAEDSFQLCLVDGVREGQFIFDMRRAQGYDGRCYVLRGSKLLYSRAARKQWWFHEHVKSKAEVRQLIDDYGIRYIVVESGPPQTPDWQNYFHRPSRWLRQVLQDNTQFELLAQYTISDDPIWNNVHLNVYRNRLATHPKYRQLTIPVPAMGRNVTITLPTN